MKKPLSLYKLVIRYGKGNNAIYKTSIYESKKAFEQQLQDKKKFYGSSYILETFKLEWNEEEKNMYWQPIGE